MAAGVGSHALDASRQTTQLADTVLDEPVFSRVAEGAGLAHWIVPVHLLLVALDTFVQVLAE